MSFQEFKVLPLPIVEIVLGCDELTIYEEEIWDSCVFWAKYQFEIKNSYMEATPPPRACVEEIGGATERKYMSDKRTLVND